MKEKFANAKKEREETTPENHIDFLQVQSRSKRAGTMCISPRKFKETLKEKGLNENIISEEHQEPISSSNNFNIISLEEVDKHDPKEDSQEAKIDMMFKPNPELNKEQEWCDFLVKSWWNRQGQLNTFFKL